MAHWDGTVETEEKIKEETKATNQMHSFRQSRRAREMRLFRQTLKQKGAIRKIV